MKRNKLRNWKLQELDKEMDAQPTTNYERDYTEFLENLEEDESFRKNINIYFGEKLLVHAVLRSNVLKVIPVHAVAYTVMYVGLSLWWEQVVYVPPLSW